MKYEYTKILLFIGLILITVGIATEKKQPQDEKIIEVIKSEDPDNFSVVKGLYLSSKSEPFYVESKVLKSIAVKEIEKEKGYYYLVEQYDWNINIAKAVMREESRGNSDAYNPEWHKGCQGSYGLMQMACLHIGKYGLTWSNIKDPRINVEAAYQLWKEEGWYPWGTCHSINGKPPKIRCW